MATKTKAAATAAKESSTVPYFDIVHVELVSCELKQGPNVKTADNPDDENYSYSSVAKDVSFIKRSEVISHDLVVGWCEFSALKEIKDEPRAEVKASYLFVCNLPSEVDYTTLDQGSFTKFMISVSIWPRFRDLVAHMMAQGSTIFPPLPIRPDRIEYVKKDAK